MIRFTKVAASFVQATVFMIVVWDSLVMDRVYHCTDATPFGYLSPGNWIHGNIQHVDSINPDATMPEADAIKNGWSNTSLWIVWSALLTISAMTSAWLAMRPWEATAGALSRLRPRHRAWQHR